MPVLVLGAGVLGLWAAFCKLLPALRRTPKVTGQPVRRFDRSDDGYARVLTQLDQLRQAGQRSGTIIIPARDLHHDDAVLYKIIDRIHSRGIHVTGTEPLPDGGGWKLTITLS